MHAQADSGIGRIQ